MTTSPNIPAISNKATSSEIKTAIDRLRGYFVGVQREGGAVTVQELIKAKIARMNKYGQLVVDDFYEVPDGASLTDEQLITLNGAKLIIDGIASDGIFSTIEKAQWKDTWDNLLAEAGQIQIQCIADGFTSEPYKNVYDASNTAEYNNWITAGLDLEEYMLAPAPDGADWGDLERNTVITPLTFKGFWDNYFVTRQIILNAITLARGLTPDQLEDIEDANNLVSGISEDGIFSTVEKLQWRGTWDNLVAEAGELKNQCVAIAITTELHKNESHVDNAEEYNTWITAGNTLYEYMEVTAQWNDTTQNTAITPATFDSNWNDYLVARQVLINKVGLTVGFTPTQKADIASANTVVAGLTDDGMMSSVEKKQYRETWEAALQEYDALSAQVTAFSLTSSAEWVNFNDACTKATSPIGLGPYMEMFWGVAYANIGIDTTFVSVGSDAAEFRSKWNLYFNTKQTLINKLADVAATRANWSGIADDDSNRPENNATVGSPAGTYVGGTLAETVEQNAADALAGAYTKTKLEVDLNAGVGDILAGSGGDYRLDVDTAGGLIIIKHKDVVYGGTASTGTNKPAIALSSTGIAMGVNRSSDGLWVASVSISASTGNATFAGTVNATAGTFSGNISVGGYLQIGSGGVFRCAKASYSDAASPGWWMDYNGGDPQFHIGNATSSFKYSTSDGAVVTGAVLGAPASGSDPSLMSWTFSGSFSATNYRDVSWTSGTLKFADGTTYAITSGSTGNMSSRTYIYFAKTISTTAFQITTTGTDAIGSGRIQIAIAKNSAITTSDAFFQVFGGYGGIMIGADEIAANSITANEISSTYVYAGTIAAGNITTGTLGVSLTMGNTFIVNSSGKIYSTGKSSYASTTNGFFLGYDTDGYKLNIGGSAKYLKWSGTDLTVVGDITGSTGTFSGSLSAANLTAGNITVAVSMNCAGYVSCTGISTTTFSTIKFPTGTVTCRCSLSGYNTTSTESSSDARCGVIGRATSTSYPGAGVLGVNTTATHGIGVVGYGGAHGVYATCNSGGRAIYAQAYSTSQVALEVSGKVNLLQSATTGTATATFPGSNKPGSNTTNGWIDIQLNGTTYYIPVWT
jgi:hypothetical protein